MHARGRAHAGRCIECVTGDQHGCKKLLTARCRDLRRYRAVAAFARSVGLGNRAERYGNSRVGKLDRVQFLRGSGSRPLAHEEIGGDSEKTLP